jgi:hypothetical protein
MEKSHREGGLEAPEIDFSVWRVEIQHQGTGKFGVHSLSGSQRHLLTGSSYDRRDKRDLWAF